MRNTLGRNLLIIFYNNLYNYNIMIATFFVRSLRIGSPKLFIYSF